MPTTPPISGSDELIPTRASLVARLKNWDDGRSWQEFFETYWRLIYGRARRAELSDQEAQEVVQETIIGVAKGIAGFRYDPAVCSFKTWLYRIVSRRIADQFRRRKQRLAQMDPLPPVSNDEFVTGEIPDPASLEPDTMWEREWEENLMAAAAERVKKRVNPVQFQIFDYHVLQGHGVSETALHLGTSRPKVYLAKHRVGRLLREEVNRLREQPV